jgi:hypothetical protein
MPHFWLSIFAARLIFGDGRVAALACSYRFADDPDAVLKLLEKCSQVPMRFADACLVRMTERS